MPLSILIIGGSDAGISAALRAHELDASARVAVVLADAFPNLSICGLPYFLSGETPDWKHLAHRTEFPGIEILTNHLATSIDPKNKTVWIKDREGRAKVLNYDKLIIGTGATPVRPPICGLDDSTAGGSHNIGVLHLFLRPFCASTVIINR
jgi:NADPH-dependent 2,4-dienoyl-CoA reductase/sulfur reductase-like enzyme